MLTCQVITKVLFGVMDEFTTIESAICLAVRNLWIRRRNWYKIPCR